MAIPYTCPYCGDRSMIDPAGARPSAVCGTCAQPIMLSQAGPGETRPAPGGYRAGLHAALIVAGLMVAVAVLGVVGWLLWPALARLNATTHATACQNNLKRIALALDAYQQAHGSYPPAYLADAQGKPMHSWRVLILPYLGRQDLYDQYNFDQPWDSPSNSLLLTQMPREYLCPANPDPLARGAGETNYMVIVGPRTMFPGNNSVTQAQISDGLGRTIMVVETVVRGVNWMSPTDLKIEAMSRYINGGSTDPGSYHDRDGAHVATADGKIHFLSNRTTTRSLENSLTINGGEQQQVTALPE